MNSKPSEFSVQSKISRMLGAPLRRGYLRYGYLARIRGKHYWFPSLTHAFDAARHGIAEYEISEAKLKEVTGS